MRLNNWLRLSLVAGVAPLVGLLQFGGGSMQHPLHAVIQLVAARIACDGGNRSSAAVCGALLGVVRQSEIAY